jgi:hypothetical protein
MHPRLVKLGRWSLLVAALLLTGCSTIQFAYNNVDWVLIDKADHYLDLNSEQRALAEELIAARMRVHRREELPLYVATLSEIRVMLADNLTADELDTIMERLKSLYRRTMGDTVPSVVTLLGDLNDAQIDHLQARFEERNREFADNFMPESLQVRLDRRVERSIRMMEFFIGDLRPEQVELVRRYRNAMPLTADDWLAYHQARQKGLLALLRRRAPRDELERYLTAWWVELADQPPALEEKMQTNTRAGSQMVLALDTTVDTEQRQKLLDILDLFIEELGELASKPT